MPRLYKRTKEGFGGSASTAPSVFRLLHLLAIASFYMVVLIQNKERANGTRNAGTDTSL
jgi:hypothetical protein